MGKGLTESGSSTSFPVDKSESGKSYQIALPDYIPTRTESHESPPEDVQHLASYLRLGVPHSLADQGSVTLGDDLLASVNYPDGFDKTLGGVRDHTDGNRVITTRQDRVEIVRGQSRTIVRADQEWDDEDDDWSKPLSSDADPSVEDHLYPNRFYEVISTTYQPGTGGAGSYGEARQKVKSTNAYPLGGETISADYYEYSNAQNLVEVYAARDVMAEKIYGSRFVEIVSTLHADHADWEGIGGYDNLGANVGAGNLVEYMFAKNLTEVIRATDLVTDKIYGDRIVEVVSTTSINDFSAETTPTSLNSGDIYEYINAGALFHEEINAHSIEEYTVARGYIIERLEAGSTIEELTTAIGAINAITVAGGGVNEITAAGDELVDIMVAGGVFLDVIAAVGAFVEVAAGLMNIDITLGVLKADITLAPIQLDISLGTKLEWSAEHHKFVAENSELVALQSEIHDVKTELSSDVAALSNSYMMLTEAALFM